MTTISKKTKLQIATGPKALALPTVDLQLTWFEVSRDKAWTSLGILPVEENLDVFWVAQGMATMASQEPESRVLLVNASLGDTGQRPQKNAKNGKAGPEPMDDDVWATVAGPSSGDPLPYDLVDFTRLPAEHAEQALSFSSKMMEYLESEGRRYTSALFAMDCPIAETRTIPLARSLDSVLLCIQPGRTSRDRAEQLINILGRERVRGAIIVNRKRGRRPAHGPSMS